MPIEPNETESNENARRRTSQPKLWVVGIAGALLAVAALAIVSGRGCTPEDPAAAALREAEKKKQLEEAEKKKVLDPKVERLVLRPGEPERAQQFIKPGHWTTASQQMKGVYENFVGESNLNVVHREGGQERVYRIEHTPFVLRSSRPVTLSKGRPKDVETIFLAPQVATPILLRTELLERGFGRNVATPNQPAASMRAYQYHFVVLAKEPTRYAFIKTIDSVKVPFDGDTDFDDAEDPIHYRVSLLEAERAIPLSDSPLTWTSIAYLLWDEVDPALFTPAQERALLDWLHWGGQLVINGPDSLDLLRNSFLEPYLPATNGGSRTIAAGDPALEELNRRWTISTRRAPGKPLAPVKPWSGVKLAIESGGKALRSTGELLVERPIGRGRIVISAMQLAERELVNWQSGFQSLFNACILRRPPRIYHEGKYGGATLAWADKELAERRLDARLTTRLQYLARDLGVDTSYKFIDVDESSLGWNPGGGGDQLTMRRYRAPKQPGGLGSWNDFSATAAAARSALREAAGVEVPDTSFVVLWLASYLILLVPLNWLVFHAIGRIEWAWIAAPLIAVAGTFIVIRQAQLDIGFVRAQTEIGLLELQGEYDRGHLSRYTSLYTSLSTTYDLAFDSLTAVAAPFPSDVDNSRNQSVKSTCNYERHDKSRLFGVFVSSNTATWVHSEQMFPLEGPIRLGKSTVQNRQQIENRTAFTLKSVAVVERPGDANELRGGWIGELRPGEASPISFVSTVRATGSQAAFAEEREAEAQRQHAELLNLEPMFQLMLDPQSFEPGERRLVARVDEVLPGETISPAASQVRGATLVVAHLNYAPLPDPRPDRNVAKSVVTQLEPSRFTFPDP